MRKFFNYLLGVLMGLLVGGVVALLLTPSSGENMRGDIVSRFLSLKEEVNQAATTKRIELEQQLQSLRKSPDQTK